MKGIILAGGKGTRLYPVTKTISKQLMPIYDKPLIYYPLSVLMLAGIRDILIITTPEDNINFKNLLKDGSDWGIKLSYAIQKLPKGLAEAFLIGEDFIGEDSVTLVLGDNIFYGHSLVNILTEAVNNNVGATLFGYNVNNPSEFGIAEIDDLGIVQSIVEKPVNPKSNLAVTGLYIYDNRVISFAKSIEPSERGELEITAVNNEYLKRNSVQMKKLGRGYTWLDTGTHDSLLNAAQFVSIIEKSQGLKIACLEEIAWRKKWISDEKVLKISESLKKVDYGTYLSNLIMGR